MFAFTNEQCQKVGGAAKDDQYSIMVKDCHRDRNNNSKTDPYTDKNAEYLADLCNAWLKSLQSSNINE